MKLRSIWLSLKTIYIYSAILVLTIPLWIFCTTIASLPKKFRYKIRAYHYSTWAISAIIMRIIGAKIVITGKHNLPNHNSPPTIIIANHSSALDIPIIETLVTSHPHLWMSKKSYKKIPVFGYLLNQMHVMVDKTSGSQALRSLIKMQDLLKNKPHHALIFPEGSRFSDGKIHDFYAGFAILAQKLNRPVIPVVIKNLHPILPKNSLLIDSSACTVKIIIGPAMHCQPGTTLEDFIAKVQGYYEDEFAKRE